MDTYYARNRKQQEEKVKVSRLEKTINSVQRTINDLFLGPFSKEDHIELRSFGISFALNAIIILSLCLYSNSITKTNPIILNISVGSTETDTIIDDAIDILPDSFPDPQYYAPEIPVANTVSEEPISVASIDNPEKLISESSSISSEDIILSINDILQNISQISSSKSESKNPNTKQSETLSSILDGLANGVATNTLSRNTESRSGGGDIANRLVSAGAKTGAIQISIAWDTIDDVDLHIQWGAPKTVGATEYINFITKRGQQTNGFLDIDMNDNQHNISITPVENVFYADENNLAGTYVIGIHLYKSRTGAMSVPVTVRIKIGSDIEIIKVTATPNIKYVKTIQYGWTPQLSF